MLNCLLCSQLLRKCPELLEHTGFRILQGVGQGMTLQIRAAVITKNWNHLGRALNRTRPYYMKFRVVATGRNPALLADNYDGNTFCSVLASRSESFPFRIRHTARKAVLLILRSLCLKLLFSLKSKQSQLTVFGRNSRCSSRRRRAWMVLAALAHSGALAWRLCTSEILRFRAKPYKPEGPMP